MSTTHDKHWVARRTPKDSSSSNRAKDELKWTFLEKQRRIHLEIASLGIFAWKNSRSKPSRKFIDQFEDDMGILKEYPPAAMENILCWKDRAIVIQVISVLVRYKLYYGSSIETYHGECVRHLPVRSRENISILLLTKKWVQLSVVCHYLLNCNYSSSFVNFSVLYQENKKYLLKLKEALFVVRDRHTHKLSPVKHFMKDLRRNCKFWFSLCEMVTKFSCCWFYSKTWLLQWLSNSWLYRNSSKKLFSFRTSHGF